MAAVALKHESTVIRQKEAIGTGYDPLRLDDPRYRRTMERKLPRVIEEPEWQYGI